MTVRAKFKCTSVTETEGGLKTAKLQAVVGKSPESEQFFKWTPNASIDLSVMNPAAAEQFAPGKEYYVDFTAAN